MFRDHFHALADRAQASALAGELVTLWFSAEESDFLRFNHARVRQSTHVRQATVAASVARDKRRATRTITLSLDNSDLDALARAIGAARDALADTPDDPYLLMSLEPTNTERCEPATVPAASEVIDRVVSLGDGLDLVGFHAGGPIYKGFANSLGQRNWHEVAGFNFEWCLYHGGDKAVKSSYAGSKWDAAALSEKMESARERLARLGDAPIRLKPGAYRAWFAPAAVSELLGLMAWGGFGLKSIRSKRSSLQRLYDGTESFNEAFTLGEATSGGLAPGFQGEGFVKPARVELVSRGLAGAPLASPRSAREFGTPTNAAEAAESPESMALEGGKIPNGEELEALGSGLYIGNLWYLNYSDRQHCRMTGMTRFACFWVENGRIKAPLDVMRFDDSAFRIFGGQLEGLGADPELVPDSITYRERSTQSIRTPGILVKEFLLTL